eukprot:TRINITY_DN65049_c0_g1_i1.p1 TRINITY_DN65049_c0_g1~~TRINITY_DN65049_c0_g1_i1.p1  ORF type:complete len:652 (-),score=287.27 TRINITY_DN65049_c0_g1_i1:119-2044(-)
MRSCLLLAVVSAAVLLVLLATPPSCAGSRIEKRKHIWDKLLPSNLKEPKAPAPPPVVESDESSSSDEQPHNKSMKWHARIVKIVCKDRYAHIRTDHINAVAKVDGVREILLPNMLLFDHNGQSRDTDIALVWKNETRIKLVRGRKYKDMPGGWQSVPNSIGQHTLTFKQNIGLTTRAVHYQLIVAVEAHKMTVEGADRTGSVDFKPDKTETKAKWGLGLSGGGTRAAVYGGLFLEINPWVRDNCKLFGTSGGSWALNWQPTAAYIRQRMHTDHKALTKEELEAHYYKPGRKHEWFGPYDLLVCSERCMDKWVRRVSLDFPEDRSTPVSKAKHKYITYNMCRSRLKSKHTAWCYSSFASGAPVTKCVDYASRKFYQYDEAFACREQRGCKQPNTPFMASMYSSSAFAEATKHNQLITGFSLLTHEAKLSNTQLFLPGRMQLPGNRLQQVCDQGGVCNMPVVSMMMEGVRTIVTLDMSANKHPEDPANLCIKHFEKMGMTVTKYQTEQHKLKLVMGNKAASHNLLKNGDGKDREVDGLVLRYRITWPALGDGEFTWINFFVGAASCMPTVGKDGSVVSLDDAKLVCLANLVAEWQPKFREVLGEDLYPVSESWFEQKVTELKQAVQDIEDGLRKRFSSLFFFL